MQYLIAQFRDINSKEELSRVLNRNGVNPLLTGCREVVNREFNNKNVNFMAVGSSYNGSQMFPSMEVLCNTDYVTKLLQDVCDDTTIFCGNRFIYKTATGTLILSPRGSIISGILKMITTYFIDGATYEKFVDNFINKCFTTDLLGSSHTGVSVGIAIRLFSDIKNMPRDPKDRNSYGTMDYLSSQRTFISRNILTSEQITTYRNYFIKLGANPRTLENFI